MTSGSTGKTRTKRPKAKPRAARVQFPDTDTAPLPGGTTILRLIPIDSSTRRTSAAELTQQAEAVARVANTEVSETIALAPSGWLRQEWGDTGLPGILDPIVDATTVLPGVKTYVRQELRQALRALPAQLVIFGADFCVETESVFSEAQFMFVYDREVDRIARATSTFSGKNLDQWLCSIWDLSTHVTPIPGLGNTLLLNSDDLAALRACKSAGIRHEEWKRRIREMRDIIATEQPETLVHIGHSLGTTRMWRPAITEIMNKYPSIERAASTSRLDEQEARGHGIEEYIMLVRGLRDVAVSVA